MEETARRERLRIEELLKSKGVQYGSYPRFSVSIKGQKVLPITFLECHILNHVLFTASGQKVNTATVIFF